jgi:hypothetical protein
VKTNLFIQSRSAVLPGFSSEDGSNDSSKITLENGTIRVLEKDFAKYIPASISRRMSSITQWSMYAALDALAQSQYPTPSAIITATGMGCLKETDNFLNQILDESADIYSPTPFIQSTHNAVGGALALHLKNNNYNATFSNRNTSFEDALIDASMQNQECILIGGFEEISNYSLDAIRSLYPVNTTLEEYKNLFSATENGMLIGEGTAFYVMSNEDTPQSRWVIADVSIVANYENKYELDVVIEQQIATLQESFSYDILMTGNNGNKIYDKWYQYIAKKYFESTPNLRYKHLTGESFAASAFGLWYCIDVLENQKPLTEYLYAGEVENRNTILLYNYFEDHHCFITIQKL